MFLQSELFNRYGVTAIFSFLEDGVKKEIDQKIYETKVLKNFKGKKVIFLNQKHTDSVALYPGSNFKTPFDGVVGGGKNIFFALRTADCNPVFIFDKKTKSFGAIHAGWRGVLEQIIEKGVLKGEKKLKIDKKDLIFSIGPSIRGCCYEVKNDLVDKFLEKNRDYEQFFNINSKKITVDLTKIIKFQLLNMGINEKSIEIIDSCTYCSNKFYSYRKDKTEMRNLSFIGRI